MWEQSLSQWWHTTQRRTGEGTSETRINDSRQASFIHAANYITLHSNHMHIVEELQIAYGTSSKLRRMSGVRIVEDFGL